MGGGGRVVTGLQLVVFTVLTYKDWTAVKLRIVQLLDGSYCTIAVVKLNLT